jgi:hypothetical protein
VYGRTNSPNGYAGYFLGGKNYFNGKVGIGTPYPGSMLDVRASSGTAISADGGSSSAVFATSSGSTVPTIFGSHSGTGPAIYGTTEGGYPCVEGLRESSGVAVAGYVTVGGTAILGSAGPESGIGVMGVQAGISPDIATYYKPGGLFGGENGVIGYSETEDGFGVFGKSNGDNGWAGAFISTANGVTISSSPTGQGLMVTGGLKSAAVRTSDGTRLLYCEEASEVWFADYGFGKLEAGVAVVPIDPVFAQTVSLAEPYHVFTEAYGNAEIYVTGRTADKFEVRLRDGDPNVEFSYRIVAKRAGFEKKRLDRAAWADNDRNLYPEKQAKVQGE